MVPVLLLVGNKSFGVSSNLRHLCAVAVGGRIEYFRYDWRRTGAWNLAFALGIMLGGAIAVRLLAAGDALTIAPATQAALAKLGVHDLRGLVPRELFDWHALTTARGLVMLIGGGILVGFGTAYAGGCTSGHAISGLADLQLPSLIAVIGFFAGGLVTTWLILPWLLRAVTT
jgi:uncharacterized membrane protein YedE/YeeE